MQEPTARYIINQDRFDSHLADRERAHQLGEPAKQL
jgi:hypothetical protein